MKKKGMTALDKIGCHRLAHDAEADEADVAHV
jgi:hypothetical protein